MTLVWFEIVKLEKNIKAVAYHTEKPAKLSEISELLIWGSKTMVNAKIYQTKIKLEGHRY